MTHHAQRIRKALFQEIDTIVSEQDLWVKQPQKDFSRKRKLTFKRVITCLLGFEGKSSSSELLETFDFSLDTPSVSALCQARDKLSTEVLLELFNRFQPKLNHTTTFHGYHIFAHDGSDIKIPKDPSDDSTYIENGKYSCNIVHLNALYDLFNRNFKEISIEDKHDYDERRSLISMVEKLEHHAIIIADRGYRSLNLYEHVRKSGQYFIIREKDTTSCNGILHSFKLPQHQEFDKIIHFKLSRRQTKAIKLDPMIRWLSATSNFDYLPSNEKTLYPMTLRVVRIEIGKGSYESLVTNLPQNEFSLKDLKQLYHFRWGIETAFRELKYALAMNSFHAKKKEYIKQEIIARVIMYNFSMRIAMTVKVKNKKRNYVYQINYTIAFSLCREYFKHKQCAVERLIQKYITPIRPGRKDERKLKTKAFIGFVYRVA